MFFGDNQISGAFGDYDSGGFDWSIPSATDLVPDFDSSSLFRSVSPAPNGVTDFETRANGFNWGFDQSKISSMFSDVLGSAIQAGGKLAIQRGADALNTQSNQNSLLGQFARNFRSTQTGAQINAGAMGSRVMDFFGNPMVWLGIVGLVILMVYTRK